MGSMKLTDSFLSNSIKSYLIVLGILLVAFIIKRIISRFFAGLIYTWIVKNNHAELKKAQLHRLVVPIEQFLLFLVAVIALYELHFPEAWNLHLFKLSLQQVIESCTKLIFIVLLIRVSLRTLEFIAKILEEKAKTTADQSDDQLVLFFRDFFKVILYIIGLLLILHYVFNENIGNLVTSLSIVGAAIALSMRESLENIIASFIIFFDKPFTVGDMVKVNNFTGTIEKIGLRSTRIRTQEKTYISVPNKQMVDNIVDNISLRTERKFEMDIQLSVHTTATAIGAFADHLRSFIKQQVGVVNAVVVLTDAGKQAHILHAEVYVAMSVEIAAFQILRERINLAAIEYANQHQIQFAEQ
jgi:MscS family membrane protein